MLKPYSENLIAFKFTSYYPRKLVVEVKAEYYQRFKDKTRELVQPSEFILINCYYFMQVR